MSSEPPSPGETTSVPILSSGTFMEVSPLSLTSDSGPFLVSKPISGSTAIAVSDCCPCWEWSDEPMN